jgi:hypothetical protein
VGNEIRSAQISANTFREQGEKYLSVRCSSRGISERGSIMKGSICSEGTAKSGHDSAYRTEGIDGIFGGIGGQKTNILPEASVPTTALLMVASGYGNITVDINRCIVLEILTCAGDPAYAVPGVSERTAGAIL